MVLEDADLEIPGEVPGDVSLENLPESLDEYHRSQLAQKDLLVQELMGTVNRLATALPEGKRPAGAVKGWWRWQWRRNG